MLVRDGLYYLFWSTQSSVFDPAGPVGPTGLYGMTSPSPLGPFRPLNDTGLVLANPRARPMQAYSWLVLADGRVASFVDQELDAGPPFGGTLAPMLRIAIERASARIVG